MTAEEQQKKDEQYMRKALVEAQQALKEGEIPIGAIVVCTDRIIAIISQRPYMMRQHTLRCRPSQLPPTSWEGNT